MADGRTRLCATVTAETTSELRARRDAQEGADLVELRLDGVADPDVGGALADRRHPVVATCRPTWEGGAFAGSEAERRRILLEACRLGAEYVDVEQRAGFADEVLDARGGRGVVLSFHVFDGVPPDLEGRYRSMRATGAEVVKIAAAAGSLTESVRVARLGRDDESRVLIGMGAAGIPSRVLAGRFGSCWTYAGDGIAPGQIDLARMREQFRFRELSEGTAVYGVLGSPIGHSLSPAMHNAGFRAHGIDAVYLPLEAADVEDFLAFADAVQLRGASVTAPFKEAIVPHVVEQDAIGSAIGAVNTVRPLAGGVWEGLNTDVHGLLAPLAGRMALAGARATVLGSGGVARAAAFALHGEGAEVTVCARRPERAAAVAAVAPGTRAAPLPPRPGSWDLLVNTTPLGTWPAAARSPLPDGPFDGRLVYDLVYNPPETRLMADAARAGCDTIGGLDMLVAQAVRQFAWWTGETPSADLFRRAAEQDLARQAQGAQGTAPQPA
ncbi:MAG: type I 3-dehydroquinate dehydratase [Acidobacteria bacterium]|nr:type I 3-dehydroquinate dehydratase [Acidobacteriota bacterium]